MVVARHPCLMDRASRTDIERIKLFINDSCKGCRYCADYFECPALVYSEDEDRVQIDSTFCAGCGVCLQVCPTGAIEQLAEDS